MPTEKRKLRSIYLTDAEYKKCEEAAGRLGFSPWAADVLIKAAQVKDERKAK
jgi:hypothetical protein